MAGRPKARRAKQLWGRPDYPELQAVYAEKWTSFDAMRTAMVQRGLVEHGLSPYEVIQRAIDDVTTDYLLLRQHIERECGTIEQAHEHKLYNHMEHLRECAVRYSTFATQYDIKNRMLQLSETRVALMAHLFREVGLAMGLDDDQIRRIPEAMIAAISSEQHGGLDEDKARALAEILANDSEVEIVDAEVVDEPVAA